MAETDLKITQRDAAIILEILSHLVRLTPQQQLLRLIVYWIHAG